eukprot:jgi/Tetstr1/432717/TSEL_022083.t1
MEPPPQADEATIEPSAGSTALGAMDASDGAGNEQQDMDDQVQADQQAADAMKELMESDPLPLQYPEPTLTHEALLASEADFNTALQELFMHLGQPLEKIPILSFKPVDLHVLYQKVTDHGGMEEVISKKMWKVIAVQLEYPSTVTSASTVLRRTYSQFLWHLEQVYFHSKHGSPAVPPPAEVKLEPKHPNKVRVRRKKDVVLSEFPAVDRADPTCFTAFPSGGSDIGIHAAMVGTKGSCTIDARFDCGYFCTVKFGRDEFKGVLYCPPPHSVATSSTDNQTNGFEEDWEPNQKRRKKEKNADPFTPKPNKTAFNYYSVDARARARAEFPGLSQAEITKKVGSMWHQAAKSEKNVYLRMAAKDKERYEADLRACKLAQEAEAAQARAAAAMDAVRSVASAVSTGRPYNNEDLDLAPQAETSDLDTPGKQPVAGATPLMPGYTVGSVPADAGLPGLHHLGLHLVQASQVVYDAQGNPLTAAIVVPPSQQQ